MTLEEMREKWEPRGWRIIKPVKDGLLVIACACRSLPRKTRIWREPLVTGKGPTEADALATLNRMLEALKGGD